ncbi:hypothetical protein MHLP_04210 [Candidatus Mycoplasma haematolamae str. Purdue]|uniref:Uncharacterized protein n=1 Tax=Mycoplasma haematolamae (strain Purdue) TaxID=1212765 RepID=I7C780_MYCHA|nr:hypothetical protein [Candidatus Mycoplasma haematolamae]AFO52422.1 hypothetical protein MHLP_04210 [Candidatus Mycoplasma haematolamae str. Purdue]
MTYKEGEKYCIYKTTYEGTQYLFSCLIVGPNGTLKDKGIYVHVNSSTAGLLAKQQALEELEQTKDVRVVLEKWPGLKEWLQQRIKDLIQKGQYPETQQYTY